MISPKCACARYTDGSITTFSCPLHSTIDPCLRMANITGRRRKGTIRRGACTTCGHVSHLPTKRERRLTMFSMNEYALADAVSNSGPLFEEFWMPEKP